MKRGMALAAAVCAAFSAGCELIVDFDRSKIDDAGGLLPDATGCEPGTCECDNDPATVCETDLNTELAHCGACDNACSDANGTPSCEDGRCSIQCDEGTADCDEDVTNGCEADFSTDPLNCSKCGMQCPAVPNASPVCEAASCTFQCNSDAQDCNQMPDDGCESNVTSDVLNCGMCGTACPAGPNSQPTCIAGACGIECDSDFSDCDGDPNNGCEAEPSVDPMNCGGCGTQCPARDNATPACAAGMCGLMCSAGFDNCDGMQATGCETEITTTTDCGSCGTACPVRDNATSQCADSQCGFTCNADFDDCDAMAENGCEANLQTNAMHCGGCGMECPARANATGDCTAGQCSIGCDAGWGNCDNMQANGCETDLQTSAAHCGGCGMACAAPTPNCSAGMCVL